MRKSVLAASAALVVLCVLGAGASAREGAKSFPLISGNYLVTINRVCQPTVTVTYGSNNGNTFVSHVSMDSNSSGGLTAASMTATNSNGSGTFTFTQTESDGDPIIVEDNQGGEFGNPLTASSGEGSVTFTQTATTIVITDQSGPSTYNIYYGMAKNGVVESAIFGGIDDKGCMQLGQVTEAK